MDASAFNPSGSAGHATHAATTCVPVPVTHVRASRPALSERLSRLWRGHPTDPTWARPAMIALLVATGLVYCWGLTSSGWANSFYSAAVQAGSVSWKAFFYGSSDAASSITVDKTPASLWVMALSVRVFGLSSFAILLPEVLMGVATVGVVYATVRRHFGAFAGLVSGLVLALTPVAVLMFRFNNPDALLTLLMALGAWATLKAVEQASPRWLVAAGVFIGFGFLTKMLQVLLVVPAFAIAYLVAAPTPLRKRLLHLLAAGGAMVVSAGWWIAIVELVPASMRPYIGGSQTNSILELALGYNGFGRITGNEVGSVGGGGGGGGKAAGGFWGATGVLRMFGSEVGGQVSWLIPSALLLLVAGLWLRGQRPRTDARRAAYLLWGGWLLVSVLTFSLMAGIFHAYYTIALAPAIGALVGMGAQEAWERRHRITGSAILAAATAVAALWAYVLLDRTPTWLPWLRFAVLVAGLAAALMLLAIGRVHRTAVPAVASVALVAALAGPAAYTASTLSSPHTGSIPSAGPAGQGGQGGFGGFPGGAGQAARFRAFRGQGQLGRGQLGRGQLGQSQFGQRGLGGPRGTGQAGTRIGGGMGGLLDASTPSTEVVAALSANASRYTWVAAAIGSQSAAGLQLATQLPVMPIGGFNGSDPSPTLAQFESYVAQGRIHYFVASGRGGGFRGLGGFGASRGGSNVASQISTWVQDHFTAVTIGGSTFYDLTKPVSGQASGATTSGTSI